MKFAYSMLLDFVQTSQSPQEIGDLLTMAGFEVESIEQVEDETVLDVKVVSNRGDGLSVLGLAREVLAKDEHAQPTELYKRAQERFPMPDVSAPEVSTRAKVKIETSDCTRYACRVFEGDFSAKTPEWMQKRLRVAGIRSISLLVDLTNYVMLEVGQPMHAFDLDTLADHEIVVRKARAGEKLTTLNGDEHELNPNQMMICDADKPVGAAGIMGGLDTEVTASTKRILLESAHFVNTSVRRTRKEMGLSTEASYRFERSVDPEGVVAALNRFAELLGAADKQAATVPGVLDVYPEPPRVDRIILRVQHASQLLGMDVTIDECERYLTKLGFHIEGRELGLKLEETVSLLQQMLMVFPPTWRPDVTQEYDVIEEVGRVHGFDKIPESPIQGTTTQGGVFGFDKFVEEVRDTLLRLGFVQNISSSLLAQHPLDDPRGVRIGPRNPHSPEMSLLRNSLWPNLADNARRNGGGRLDLFEIGAVFGVTEPDSEVRKAGMLSSGGAGQEDWTKTPQASASFFAMKSAVEEVLRHSGLPSNWELSRDPRLHPTRQAGIEQGVLLGQIHPDIAEELDLPPQTFLAEIDLELLYAHRPESRQLKPISRNPAVRRDIAIQIDKAIPYSQIETAIRSASGDLLEKQWLFDVYEGKGIPEGQHSLGIALQLRKFGENLTDEEANQVRDSAVAALARLGAIQR